MKKKNFVGYQDKSDSFALQEQVREPNIMAILLSSKRKNHYYMEQLWSYSVLNIRHTFPFYERAHLSDKGWFRLEAFAGLLVVVNGEISLYKTVENFLLSFWAGPYDQKGFLGDAGM